MPNKYNRRGPIREQLEAQLGINREEALEEIEQIDNDGDGHDDRNGRFVDGNQEAADPETVETEETMEVIEPIEPVAEAPAEKASASES